MLVIIGLIVGGVLVGQDLIKAAAARAQIAQIEKFNTATNTFRDKYGGIPGDLTINLANQFGFFVPGSCTGQKGGRDGNGLIDGSSGIHPYAALMGENALFWDDLSVARLTENSYTFSQASCSASVLVAASSLGNYLPQSKIGNGGYIIPYELNGSNWYMVAAIGDFSPATSLITATPSIPVSLAYAIDSKMDDGLPTTGNVVGVYVNGSQTSTTLAPNAATDSATTCYNSASNAYSIGYNNGAGVNCALSFRFQ